jgi:hypothetical protein
MTEDEWLGGSSAYVMLEALSRASRTSDRKLRLFACACGRAIWPPSRGGSVEQAVGAGERFADGLIGQHELEEAASRVPQVRADTSSWRHRRTHLAAQAVLTALATTRLSAWDAAWEAITESVDLLAGARCDLIREVFGNPFRTPYLDPDCFRHDGRTTLDLARAIYDSRDFEDLPILADALEDAGCADRHLLAHLHEPEGHALGCWALDLVLDQW